DLGKRGTNVTRVVLTPSALAPEAKPETILMRARRLGLATSRLPSFEEGGEALQLAPVNVEDLLLRPRVKIDYGRLEAFVRNKAIIETGGGGSIGAEICDRIVTFGAGRVLMIENSEPALHAVLEMLATNKASERVSVLGGSKRLAELYCQALDKNFARRGDGRERAMRLIAVRFGNVLASNGSVVPKFKAQIEAGGPLTVTHPEMVRYF